MAVFLVVLLVFDVASSLNLGNPQGLHFDVNSEYATSYEDYKPRDYKFEYGVSDPHTGDHKSHWEVRENGVVRGEYSLLEPDGTTRVVQYTADDHGFRAVVKKIGHAVHESYHGQNLHETPTIIPEGHGGRVEQPYFKTYDGNADNYISIVDDSNILSLLNHNHQISQAPVLGTDVQGSIVAPQVISGSEVDYHGYQSADIAEVEAIPANQQLYSENHVPVQQESVHLTEPIYYHEPIHVIDSINHQPVYSYYSSHPKELASVQIQEPIHIHEPIRVQEPLDVQEHVNVISNSKELPVTIGLKVEHPHGESSSSFIGRTGNPDDDSAYTKHDEASSISGVQNYSGWKAYESPLPYRDLKKRSAGKNIEKVH